MGGGGWGDGDRRWGRIKDKGEGGWGEEREEGWGDKKGEKKQGDRSGEEGGEERNVKATEPEEGLGRAGAGGEEREGA